MSESDTGTHDLPGTVGGAGPNGANEIILNDPIIDLTDPEGTWDRVEHDLNPFERLEKPDRMRLMIRVLCELVAEGEIDDDGNPIEKPQKASNAGSQPASGSN